MISQRGGGIQTKRNRNELIKIETYGFADDLIFQFKVCHSQIHKKYRQNTFHKRAVEDPHTSTPPIAAAEVWWGVDMCHNPSACTQTSSGRIGLLPCIPAPPCALSWPTCVEYNHAVELTQVQGKPSCCCSLRLSIKT